MPRARRVTERDEWLGGSRVTDETESGLVSNVIPESLSRGQHMSEELKTGIRPERLTGPQQLSH